MAELHQDRSESEDNLTKVLFGNSQVQRGNGGWRLEKYLIASGLRKRNPFQNTSAR
ncbi:MAG: hypothetical protein VX617_06955 [Pseudomonadota bacterium]|nr:hypothetical protein [Pseudomonadota bacterium]